eukprot:g2307.t1
MADVIVHLDLNKTVLAVDEVKNYGREEVLYLEQWKGDEAFLRWAHSQHGGDAAYDAWVAELKVSKNEPQLIQYAHAYCAADSARADVMTQLMAKVGADDCVNSFWRLLDWIKAQDRKFLLVFRTFGSDMPSMFDRCDAHGYGEHVARGATGEPLIWTMLHPADAAAGFAAFESNGLDCVDGFVQPGNPVPGPREKGTDAFKERTVPFEKVAKAQFDSGGALAPSVYTAPPRVAGGRLQAIEALDRAKLLPATELPRLFASVAFGEGERLRIMGVQDNYKPWSRKNPLNGKVLVLDPARAPRQLFFDDYNFTKGEGEGTYICAMLDAAGAPIRGGKSELQAKYSAEGAFRGGDGNHPVLFTALLNKKGVEDTAVGNPEYFTSRVQAAL